MTAYFHLQLRSVAKGKGRSRAIYIMRLEGYAKREDLRGSGCGNLPAWAGEDAIEFFTAADEHERKNGVVGKELIVAIPRDLTEVEQRELLDMLIREIVRGSHAYCFGFHVVKSSDSGTNPHLHLLWCERIDDGLPRARRQYFRRARPRSANPIMGADLRCLGGCRKDRRFALFSSSKGRFAASPELLKLRTWWAERCREALERYGIAADISPRSNKARHIPMRPGVHVFSSGFQMEARGLRSRRAEENRAAAEENRAVLAEESLAVIPSERDAAGCEEACEGAAQRTEANENAAELLAARLRSEGPLPMGDFIELLAKVPPNPMDIASNGAEIGEGDAGSEAEAAKGIRSRTPW